MRRKPGNVFAPVEQTGGAQQRFSFFAAGRLQPVGGARTVPSWDHLLLRVNCQEYSTAAKGHNSFWEKSKIKTAKRGRKTARANACGVEFIIQAFAATNQRLYTCGEVCASKRLRDFAVARCHRRDKPANFHQRRSLRKQTTPRLRRGTLPPPRQIRDFLPAAK